MAPAPRLEVQQSFLNSCLMESDPAQERRARRVKQRALLVSIVLQILIVAALVLVPLLSKGENIASRVVIMPAVPYARGNNHARKTAEDHRRSANRSVCHFCQPDRIPVGIPAHDPAPRQQESDNTADDSEISRYGAPQGDPHGYLFTDSTRGPKPPDDQTGVVKPPVRYQISEPIQMAMLIRRVQPTYPPLAIQIHREGRVELRAIIATDGTIQSLEVISGDPFFIQSALAAVRDWRYRPTILNGQPVEVDTHITVIYTLNH